jgi:hypothetical protein
MIPIAGRTRFLILVATLVTGYEPPSSAFAQGRAAAPAARLSEARDRFLVAGDVRLRYREIGRGDPVVLLHGATRDLESWVGFADSLAADQPPGDRARPARAWPEQQVHFDWFLVALMDGKFMAQFSFLFGDGFGLMLDADAYRGGRRQLLPARAAHDTE